MASKEYSVFIEPSADERLASHIEFLARVNNDAAVKLFLEFEDALGILRDYPEICPLYMHNMPVDAILRYKLFGKRYRIVFEIVDNAVFVYDIQDCLQDTDKNLV